MQCLYSSHRLHFRTIFCTSIEVSKSGGASSFGPFPQAVGAGGEHGIMTGTPSGHYGVNGGSGSGCSVSHLFAINTGCLMHLTFCLVCLCVCGKCTHSWLSMALAALADQTEPMVFSGAPPYPATRLLSASDRARASGCLASIKWHVASPGAGGAGSTASYALPVAAHASFGHVTHTRT